MNSHYVFDLINDNLKIITLPALVLLGVSPLKADWAVLNSGTTKDLKAVEFPVNENTGFAVGRDGTILKTSDAGSTWSKTRSGVKSNLLDVDFINNQVGYVSGVNGTILKTENGGVNWTKLNSGTSQHLYSIHFPVDQYTGYAGGAASTLLKTTDGGLTWLPQSIGGGYVYDIVFPENNLSGYASAIYGSLGWIYKTTNGGSTWVKVLDLEDGFLKSMSFPVDTQTGYVANHDTYSRSGIWKTSDGGTTWSYVTQGITSVPVAIDFAMDNQNGIAVGFSGDVIKTNDGGLSWTEGNLGVNNYMQDIDLVNNNIGYAVGSSGLIVKTTDGGGTPVASLYLHPSSMGNINTFTDITGCSEAWDCVNDQTVNAGSGLPEGVNSRDNVSDGSGNRIMFALDDGAISSNQQVTEICVSLAATQFNGPMASLSYQRLGVDSSPVDTVPFWVGSYWYNGITTHCWKNLNWTSTDLDSLEIGVKTVAGKWLEASQMYVKVYISAP